MPAGRRLHRLTVWVRLRALRLTACGQAQGHDPFRRGTCPDHPFARHVPSSMRRLPTSRYRGSGGRRSPRPTITSLAAGTRPPRSKRLNGRNRAAGWRANSPRPIVRKRPSMPPIERALPAPPARRGVTGSPASTARSSEVPRLGALGDPNGKIAERLYFMVPPSRRTARTSSRSALGPRSGRLRYRHAHLLNQPGRVSPLVVVPHHAPELGCVPNPGWRVSGGGAGSLPLGRRCAPQLCLPASQLAALTLRAATDMAGMTAPLPA
jgi:hypothetical protein